MKNPIEETFWKIGLECRYGHVQKIKSTNSLKQVVFRSLILFKGRRKNCSIKWSQRSIAKWKVEIIRKFQTAPSSTIRYKISRMTHQHISKNVNINKNHMFDGSSILSMCGVHFLRHWHVTFFLLTAAEELCEYPCGRKKTKQKKFYSSTVSMRHYFKHLHSAG